MPLRGGYVVRMGTQKGHTQGVPLRGDTWFAWAPKKGTHKGCPYGVIRDSTGLQEGAPTRGAPTGRFEGGISIMDFLWVDCGKGGTFVETLSTFSGLRWYNWRRWHWAWIR